MVDVKDWFTSRIDGVYKFKWRLAQVIQVDSTDKRRVKISYEGWGSAFDEWIDVTEPDRYGARRVVECGKHTLKVHISDISGAEGSNAGYVNGTFRPTDEVQKGRPVYAKEGNLNMWLYYAVDQKWWVAATANKDAGMAAGAASSMELNLLDPTQGQRWTVSLGGAGSNWEEQASVRVVRR